MADFDTIIRGGTVVDGTGMPRMRTDLGIKDGKVAAVDGLRSSDADRVIDADGLIVAPGFVDLHTHYDAQLYWDPWCTISGWHGVTSVVVGNCGFGFAPCRPEDRDRSMLSMTRNEQISLEAMQAGLPWDWESIGEFMDSLDRTPKGVNVLSFAPLSPIIIYAMGGYDVAKSRRPSDTEIKAIQRLLHDAMDAGCAGWSVQRLGENSIQPDFDGTPMVTDVMSDEEGFAFAEVLRERGEGTIQLTYSPIGKESLADMFNVEPVLQWSERLAEISGRPVLHNLVQSADGMPEMHQGFLAWLASCHQRGLSVYGQGETNRNFQQFDFTTWNGFDIAPGWKAALMGTPEERLANLRNPEMRAAMIADRPWLMAIEGLGMKLDNFDVVASGGSAAVEPYVGRKLGEIGAAEGKDVLDVMIDLAIASELKAEFRSPLVRVPNADYTAELLTSGHVVPGISDGGAHSKYFVGGTYTTDLLTWLVRDTGTLTLEQAHFVLSALPARVAGIKDRGTLTEGAPADIVIYDLENL
ncbi:MAG: amidohydrolase family protein, partial [Actinomycetota bacterium]|nr:amidohydrolase family protein [Actinomycetota bacterium]